MEELRTRAQEGLRRIEDAIAELLRSNSDGLTNTQITELMGLHSDQGGKQKNYLAWSILGRMMKDGRVMQVRSDDKRATYYKLRVD
jgi:hypothetical protein